MSSETAPIFTHFKFLDLKSYASQEYLANGQKRYRKVFDTSITSYIYAELSLCNKRLEVDDWELKVIFRCHSVGGDQQLGQEICSEEVVVQVPQADHIIEVSFGWGNPTPGAYWQEGTYAWVAWIDGVAVGKTLFGLQNLGAVTGDQNPYFDIGFVNLFEGATDEAQRPEDRAYATRFAQDTTRYIWATITFENLQRKREWVCEMSFLFYTGSRELKGRNNQLALITPEIVTVDLCGGWGSP